MATRWPRAVVFHIPSPLRGRRGFILEMQQYGADSRDWGYTLTRKGAKSPLFKGADFTQAAAHINDARYAAIGLMGFLTLRRGDTDESYFRDYTPQQKRWSASSECEYLQGDFSALEGGEESERYRPRHPRALGLLRRVRK